MCEEMLNIMSPTRHYQIKTIVISYYIATGVAKTEILSIPNADKDEE